MKITVLFTSLFLSWVAFDLHLHRRNEAADGRGVSLYDEVTAKKKLRKVFRKSISVIPEKFRKRKVRLRSKCSYFSTKLKDPRDSNQRKIRRRFNNM